MYKANYRGQEVAAKVLNSQMDRRQLAEFQKFVAFCPPACMKKLFFLLVFPAVAANAMQSSRC